MELLCCHTKHKGKGLNATVHNKHIGWQCQSPIILSKVTYRQNKIYDLNKFMQFSLRFNVKQWFYSLQGSPYFCFGITSAADHLP